MEALPTILATPERLRSVASVLDEQMQASTEMGRYLRCAADAIEELREGRNVMLQALVMVRDADNDGIRDGLPGMPSAAIARLHAAIARGRS